MATYDPRHVGSRREPRASCQAPITRIASSRKRIVFLDSVPADSTSVAVGFQDRHTFIFHGIFENYRSAHHPDLDVRFGLASAYHNGVLDGGAAQRTLQRRDRTLWLEMESFNSRWDRSNRSHAPARREEFVLTMRCVLMVRLLDRSQPQLPGDSSPFARLDRIRLRVRTSSRRSLTVTGQARLRPTGVLLPAMGDPQLASHSRQCHEPPTRRRSVQYFGEPRR